MAEDASLQELKDSAGSEPPFSAQGALTLAPSAHPALLNTWQSQHCTAISIPGLSFYRANTALTGWQAEGAGFKPQFATDCYGP